MFEFKYFAILPLSRQGMSTHQSSLQSRFVKLFGGVPPQVGA